MHSIQNQDGHCQTGRVRFPAIHIQLNDALPAASFKLAHAHIRWSESLETSGWGRDRHALTAQDKAFSEAVERHAHAQLPDSALWGCAQDLPSVICPAALLGYSTQQYGRPDFPFAAFSEQQSYWWLQARNVLDQRSIWILADVVCSPRAFDSSYRKRLLSHATTSGCASAADLETALLNATFELLERDAFMRHWFAQQGGHAIASDSLPESFRWRIELLRAAGCSAGIQCLYLGHHPVWLAWAQHEELHFTSVGLATGLDAGVALESALSELETQALARLEGVPAQDIRAEQVRTPADHAALYATADYFRRADALGLGRQATDGAAVFQYQAIAPGFRVRPDALHARLAQRGHPLHCVDLSQAQGTCPSDGAVRHTVRAVAPGLIPMSFGSIALPLAMDTWQRPGSRALHPFC